MKIDVNCTFQKSGVLSYPFHVSNSTTGPRHLSRLLAITRKENLIVSVTQIKNNMKTVRNTMERSFPPKCRLRQCQRDRRIFLTVHHAHEFPESSYLR